MLKQKHIPSDSSNFKEGALNKGFTVQQKLMCSWRGCFSLLRNYPALIRGDRPQVKAVTFFFYLLGEQNLCMLLTNTLNNQRNSH